MDLFEAAPFPGTTPIGGSPGAPQGAAMTVAAPQTNGNVNGAIYAVPNRPAMASEMAAVPGRVFVTLGFVGGGRL